MRRQRLLQTHPLLRRPAVPLRQQSRLPQHSPNAGRAHRDNVGIQHHERQPPIVFQRVLQVDGLLMVSSFGPDTLHELRDAFSLVDHHPHTLHFPDMHDLGDMLVGAGFGDPVMDMETFTLTYTDMEALARDLRGSGLSNSAQGRRRSLMGKAGWQSACHRYEALRRDGRLPATFEIVYGHAWKVPPRHKHGGPAIVNTDLLKMSGRRSGR